MNIDTANRHSRYLVLVIDCWAEPGDEHNDPEPEVLQEFEAVAVEYEVTTNEVRDGSAHRVSTAREITVKARVL